MRKLFALIALFTSTLLSAQECVSQPCPWISVFYFAPKAYHEKLEFHGNGNLPAIEGVNFTKDVDGVLFGFDTGCGVKANCGLWGQFELSYSGGKLQNSGIPDRYVYDFDVEATFGFVFECSRISFIPYGGIGYAFDKHKFNHVGEENNHHLRLSYRTYYIPCGVLVNVVISHCFEIGINFKAMPQINSKMKINSGDHRLLNLGKQCGYTVEIPITYNSYYWNYSFKWLLIPFWSRRDYGSSDPLFTNLPNARIPQQTYTDIGVKIEAGILF